jgi:hypothetical protein
MRFLKTAETILLLVRVLDNEAIANEITGGNQNFNNPLEGPMTYISEAF